jgi:hypothetical protein
MKNIRSIVLLGIGLAAYCFLHASPFAQDPQASAKTSEQRELQYKTLFVDHTWNFSYSFPSPPHKVPPIKGSFRFVLKNHQIEGYEDNLGNPRLVLRGTLTQDDSNDISWKINFGAVGGQNDPSAGQNVWDCAKRTRFGQWIPTSLSISPDKQTISFQYPILEAGSEGDKVEHCREVPVLYRITQAHKFL